jgi:dolichol-phosphate mannosyltransferase
MVALVSRAGEGAKRPVILVPTYNERENLDPALEAIFAAQPEVEVCVIDDASPDGTGDLADAWAARDPRVHVLHRAAKAGLGRAYLHGFRWALDHPHRFTHVLQMDADGSHDARYLGDLLGACDRGADLALGSRWVAGGGVERWSAHRKLISRGGSLYARTVLGVRIRDLTGGFKCFTRRVLEALPLDRIRTVGYGFQIEVTYRVLGLGFTVVEVPIVFPDRVRGTSKMSARIFAEGLVSVWRLRGDSP